MAPEIEVSNRDAKIKKTEPGAPKKRYKYCIVPECKSTTSRTPYKLFFSIPTGELRRRWCEAIGRVPPKHKPLSLMCNRFCCEDHFDLEKDMENYLQWKLMGRKGAKKLILKKGVLPHKFFYQDEPTPEVKEKRRKQLIEEILEEARRKELKVILDQKNKKEKQKNKWTLPELRPKEMPQENPKVKKISEEDKISEQIKKIKRISHAPQVDSKKQEIQTYTFLIKVEAEDDLESNDGDSITKDLSQDANTADEDNNHLLDIDIKVEELDEEFEPQLVDVEIKENIIEDETNGTVTTEINPVLTENNTPNISNDDKGDDYFKPVNIGEIQETVEGRTNPVSTKTNNFAITENIRNKKVFERVIMGKRIQEIIEE